MNQNLFLIFVVIFSIKNFIPMEKEFTEKEYENYMKVLDDYIKKAETTINDLWKFKEVRQL
jgi:hypothetical protein